MNPITAVLERIAPHEPIEEQVTPYGTPDLRTFAERLHDADTSRAENPNTIWANAPRAIPSIEVYTCWQWTHWGIGLDTVWQHGGPKGHEHGFMSRLDTMLMIGPWSISVGIAWNYPESEKRYWK
jgi:hypothetical protein